MPCWLTSRVTRRDLLFDSTILASHLANRRSPQYSLVGRTMLHSLLKDAIPLLASVSTPSAAPRCKCIVGVQTVIMYIDDCELHSLSPKVIFLAPSPFLCHYFYLLYIPALTCCCEARLRLSRYGRYIGANTFIPSRCCEGTDCV